MVWQIIFLINWTDIFNLVLLRVYYYSYKTVNSTLNPTTKMWKHDKLKKEIAAGPRVRFCQSMDLIPIFKI